jgi:hypothetical protein
VSQEQVQSWLCRPGRLRGTRSGTLREVSGRLQASALRQAGRREDVRPEGQALLQAQLAEVLPPELRAACACLLRGCHTDHISHPPSDGSALSDGLLGR